MQEMMVGNWAESTGNNDNVTQLSPLALKGLPMPLTNGCQSKDTCTTHALFSAGFVPLMESGLLKGKRRNYTPWVSSNSTILRRNITSTQSSGRNRIPYSNYKDSVSLKEI